MPLQNLGCYREYILTCTAGCAAENPVDGVEKPKPVELVADFPNAKDPAGEPNALPVDAVNRQTLT